MTHALNIPRVLDFAPDQRLVLRSAGSSQLLVKSGDVLVVRVSPRSTRDQVMAMHEQLVERLPDDVGVIIVACEELAAYCPPKEAPRRTPDGAVGLA